LGFVGILTSGLEHMGRGKHISHTPRIEVELLIGVVEVEFWERNAPIDAGTIRSRL
jgi:hypothetical protein